MCMVFQKNWSRLVPIDNIFGVLAVLADIIFVVFRLKRLWPT